MARDRANIRTDIWADDHWRSLSHDAQWLYEFIMTSASLNLCGVADWRPAKWSGMSSDLTKQKIESWARELEDDFFLVIDRDTEEVMIRSFFRHDGILAQPNAMKGAAREFATVGSALIRGVISHELSRLKEEFPEGIGKGNVWGSVPELKTLLKTHPIDVRNPSENPSGNPSVDPSDTSTSTYNLKTKEPAPAVLVTEKDFNDAYSHWPKKVERKEAFTRFKAAAKRHPHGLDGLKADIARFGDAYRQTTERKYTPALGVWLNGDRWTDELPGNRKPEASNRVGPGNLPDGYEMRGKYLFKHGKPTVGGPYGMTNDQAEAWMAEALAEARARRGA